MRTVLLLLFTGLFAATPVEEGLSAFARGDAKAAAEAFERVTDRSVRALAAFDAGVARLALGETEEAIRRFEESATSADGTLREAALINLAVAHLLRGDAIRGKAPGNEEREAKVKRLSEAATAFRTALAVFRRAPAEAPEAVPGERAAKVRLLATLDEIAKLAAEAAKEAEDAALKDPPALVLRLLAAERERRRTAARLAEIVERRRRSAARALRAAEHADRTLSEKLAAALPEEMKAAREPVERAAAAMAEAEGLLDGLDAAGAAGAQGRAIVALTQALLSLPVPLPAVAGKLRADQDSTLSATKGGGLSVLADEEREIEVVLGALAMLPDPGPSTEPEAGGPPALSPEVVAKIRELAGAARDSARAAAEDLSAKKLAESVPAQEDVLAKLDGILALLPKPPEPVAEKIRRILEAEREARRVVDTLPGRDPEARTAEAKGLAERQTEQGRAAGEAAGELSNSPGDREKEAAGKVREAEREIFDSAESLRRERMEPAGEAVDRAIERLEEALELLSGQQDQQKDDGQQQQQPKPDGSKQEEKPAAKLDPAEARRQMEEMDRNRREEEGKLFPGSGGPRVEKDW